MNHNKPYILPIRQIIHESPRVKTFIFNNPFKKVTPGQFVMGWIPGHDELPFAIMVRDHYGFMISIAAVGDSTRAFHKMKIGDNIGFRGPYGSVFHIPPKARRIALLGGGYGMATVSYLAQEAKKKKIEVDVYIGARTVSELLFIDWMKHIGTNLYLSTDDGSTGYKGFNTDLFAKNTRKIKYDYVATVGPEIMEYKVAQICYSKKIPFEVSLERYMKCGIGVCGSCCVDDTGWRMCVEGTVIDGERLKKITEFGKYHRSASGTVEYFSWMKK